MLKETCCEQTIAEQNNLGDELIQLYANKPALFAKLFDEFYNRARSTASQ